MGAVRSLLDGRCSTFEGAEVISSIDRDGDERVVVLVEEQAANDFVRADVQAADALICVCTRTKIGWQVRACLLLERVCARRT